MPINRLTGIFSRIWQFVDHVLTNDPITRTDLDIAMDDLATGVRSAMVSHLGVMNIVDEWVGGAPFPTVRPGGAAIQARDAWIVTSAGTRDGVSFAVGDVLYAKVAGGGTTYSGKWLRVPQTTDVVGRSLNDLLVRFREIASTAKTTFVVTDGYTAGSEFVYLNGVLLNTSDYVATNGTSIVLTSPCAVGDEIAVTSYVYGATQTDKTMVFATRALFVAWAASNTPSAGTIVHAGESYWYSITGTDIDDLPGWNVLGETTVRHYGAVGDGIADDKLAIERALTKNIDVHVPDGVFAISGRFTVPPGRRLRGTVATGSIIRLMATAPLTVGGMLLSGGNCLIENIGFDGNFPNRPTATDGNGTFINSSKNQVRGCAFYNWKNAGILLDGQVTTCSENVVDGCDLYDNGAQGVSQNKVDRSRVTDCRFSNNGQENLSIDNESSFCVVSGNHFNIHRNGVGNIGIDESSNCSIVNNIIDNKNSVLAAPLGRNGICLQGNLGPSDQIVISGNNIINCATAGVHIKNGIFLGGEASITGNTFGGNGVDCQLNGLSGVTTMRGNVHGSNPFATTSASDALISRDSGSTAWFTRREADLPFNVSPSFVTIQNDTAALLKGCSESLGQILVASGGLYLINAKVRVIGLTGKGVTSVTLALITPTSAGGTITRTTSAPVISGQDYLEVQLAVSAVLGGGPAAYTYLQLKCSGGTGQITIDGGSDNYFTGAYLA